MILFFLFDNDGKISHHIPAPKNRGWTKGGQHNKKGGRDENSLISLCKSPKIPLLVRYVIHSIYELIEHYSVKLIRQMDLDI